MTMTETSQVQQAPHHKDTVTIKVNDDPVTVERRLTGAQIKQAAIAAGVPIQPDFVLSRVLPNGKQKGVDNDEEITLHEGEEFWAIPGDDNS
jgi:hypothetical protein